jgi:alkylation response protein AidB-like acyl-CoA dehydrogenase
MLDGALDAEAASMAKLWCSELQGRVVDACVQPRGRYGFMAEMPVARAYVDARAQRIYGGTKQDRERAHLAQPVTWNDLGQRHRRPAANSAAAGSPS